MTYYNVRGIGVTSLMLITAPAPKQWKSPEEYCGRCIHDKYRHFRSPHLHRRPEKNTNIRKYSGCWMLFGSRHKVNLSGWVLYVSINHVSNLFIVFSHIHKRKFSASCHMSYVLAGMVTRVNAIHFKYTSSEGFISVLNSVAYSADFSSC
jgi:hypothetical protein